MKDNVLIWLQEWYKSQCNGDWEHEYGIRINTIDNPGWYISIDLSYTKLANIRLEVGTIEQSESDWYFYHIKGEKYEASGDPNKLEFLLSIFKNIVEEYDTN